MKTVTQLAFLLIIVLVFTACQDEKETLIIKDKTIRPPKGEPGDFVDRPGGLPYPNIIENIYIPDVPGFAHTRCRAYRIEWPEYVSDVDPDWIPSLFSVGSGSLNSINYINNTGPANKAKLDFSLYYDNMLKSPYGVDAFWPWHEDYKAKTTRFVKFDLSLKHLQDWVTQRPSQFEYHYTHTMEAKSEEVPYQTGDLFLMWQTNDNLYGGVRIVSECPRIIEVYIAENNI